MSRTVSIAFNDYEWFEPLLHGRVQPDAFDVDPVRVTEGGERHDRMMAGEFDVAEFSLGTYITGWPDWPYTAIPVFPRRFFPHSRVFVRSDAGIETPRDLEGKRVWIHSYQNTLALWAKGVFAEEDGLDVEAVEWCAGVPEPYPVEPPVEVTHVGSVRGVEPMLRGEVDAAISPSTGEYYPLPDGVERLFPDVMDAQTAYHEATGFYPLMHTVLVRDDLLAEAPWLATELLKLFRTSHAAFAERVTYEAKYPLVGWRTYVEQERERFGDVWATSFGFEANEAELETMIRYAHEQGLVEAPHDPRELFVATDTLPG